MLRGAARKLEHLLFDPSASRVIERRLALVVLGLVALATWLIVWPFIPPLVSRLIAALIDLLGWIWSVLSSIPWSELLPRSWR